MPHIRRFILGISTLILLLLSFLAFPSFAAFFDRAVGARLRTLLSALFGIFPFSVTELFLLLLIPGALLLGLLFLGVRRSSLLAGCLSMAFFFYLSLFSFVFAPGIYRPPLEEALGLSPEPITDKDLLFCAAQLSELAKAPPEPPGEEVLKARITAAYAALDGHYGIAVNRAVRPKRSGTSLFTRLGYFGLYSFPFGEVTVNGDTLGIRYAFTLAHELAHASGFVREGEADIVAYLVCTESKDPYLAYVGAAGMLDRLLCELYTASPELWQIASEGLPPTAREDLSEGGAAGEDTAVIARPNPDYSHTVTLLCALLRARRTSYEYTV